MCLYVWLAGWLASWLAGLPLASSHPNIFISILPHQTCPTFLCYYIELVEGIAAYLLSCQTYEGGFGGEPGNEAHGGYNFCTLAGLLILGKVRLTHSFWLIQPPSFLHAIEFSLSKRHHVKQKYTHDCVVRYGLYAKNVLLMGLYTSSTFTLIFSLIFAKSSFFHSFIHLFLLQFGLVWFGLVCFAG